MTSIKRAANAIATILIREGIHLPAKHGGHQTRPPRPDCQRRRTGEGSRRNLTFINHAYDAGGTTGLLLQTLLETGLHTDPPELAQMLRLHMGVRHAGPLFQRRERGAGTMPYTYSRQRIGQIVPQISRKTGITKRVYPHHLHYTMATKLWWLVMDIIDVQRSLAREYRDDAALRRNHGRDPAPEIRSDHGPGCAGLVWGIGHTRGDDAALLAVNLLSKDQVARPVTSAGA